MDIETFKLHGLDRAWGDLHAQDYQVNGRSNAEILQVLDTPGDAHYHPCPEAYVREGVVPGQVLRFRSWIKVQCLPAPVATFGFINPMTLTALMRSA